MGANAFEKNKEEKGDKGVVNLGLWFREGSHLEGNISTNKLKCKSSMSVLRDRQIYVKTRWKTFSGGGFPE